MTELDWLARALGIAVRITRHAIMVADYEGTQFSACEVTRVRLLSMEHAVKMGVKPPTSF